MSECAAVLQSCDEPASARLPRVALAAAADEEKVENEITQLKVVL